MSSEILTAILLLIVLIFLNAIFASAEIAVLTTNPAKLKKMAGEGNKKAKKLVKLTDQPARFLSTIQVAITLAGLLQSAFAADTFALPLVSWVIRTFNINIDPEILRPIAIIIITLILSYFTLIFGELVPKRIAMKKYESMSLKMAGMLYGVSKVFSPIVWLLTVSTNGILKIMGYNPDENEEQVTEEEICLMLAEGNEQGTIEEEESEIIQNVFQFNDTDVDQICTHRRDIVMLDIDDTDKDWAEIINSNRHTFYPICANNQNDIVGILDTRDYFRTKDKSRSNIMEIAVTAPFIVPEGMRANVLLSKMKENHKHFAVIIDEYGSLSGIITLHDLLESLVGDLNESEEEETPDDIIQIDDTTWKIQGFASLTEVNETLNVNISDESYDTFSGFICDLIGRVPDDGEAFTCETDEMSIEVHNVENYVIGEATVKVLVKADVEEEEE